MQSALRGRRRETGILLVAAVVAIGSPPAQDPPVPTPGNRLADESSPYLRQHADNPVHWLPWGEAAWALARQTDKPVFLSIGYSACHWCHVMAKESFADAATAAVLNAHFVCIKVDREERPDVDEIYLAAVEAMGQHGGWPLSVWLTPTGKPFFGGTYFPPQDQHGRPGFRRVCEALAKAWQERRAEVLAGADGLAAHLGKALAPELAPGEPLPDLLAGVLPGLRARFDARYGGFGSPPHYAPKFPSALELLVLLGLPDEEPQQMVRMSLSAMARGGIHDQLGGGFHRYSTDRQWLVPHFEKMLYDNALLVPVYLAGAAQLGDPEFAGVARATLEYLLRELRAPVGGFWTSQDAQSDGGEGRHFVWRQHEFEAVLGDLAPLACRHFGVTAAGNWEGANVLSVVEDARTLAQQSGRDLEAVRRELAVVREKLLASRDQRPRPATDDKILAGWNGLALSALAAGGAELGEQRYVAAARAAADFALRELVVDGRLRRSWRGGAAALSGVLEDHGALAAGLLSLFEVDGDPRWLAAARDLLRVVVERFGADDGGLWSTADDHEQLLVRTKSVWDGAVPAGAASACLAMLRAGLLLGDEALYERGIAVLRANHQALAEAPAAASGLLLALQFHVGQPREIVVAGEPGDARTQALLAAARRLPGPKVVALLHAGNRLELQELSPVFAGKEPVDGRPAAYVCRRGICDRPVVDPAALAGAR
jgi:uncharacterized protein YyaL (SSP411 family)